MFGREQYLPVGGWAGGYPLTSACHSWVPSCSCSSCSVAWPTATGRRCYTETSSPRTCSSTRGENSSWLTLVPPASPFFLSIPQPYSPNTPLPHGHLVSFPISLSKLCLGHPQSQLYSSPLPVISLFQLPLLFAAQAWPVPSQSQQRHTPMKW